MHIPAGNAIMNVVMLKSNVIHRYGMLAAAVVFASVADAIASLLATTLTIGTPFSDGAVLQRGMPIPVWGHATPGGIVAVEFAGQRHTAKAGSDGSWRVELHPLEASRVGRTLTTTESAPGWLFDTTIDVVEVKDVLVGEVWFASGQSNMNCPVWGGNARFRQGDGAVLREITNLAHVRYMKNERIWSVSPRRIESKWRSMTPDNLRSHSVSALAFLFARDIALALDVPVGIVDSSWGGTGIDAWTPRSGYDGCDPLLDEIAAMPVGEVFDPSRKIGGINSAVQQPTVLFNGLVASWAPMAMRGFIWYQGCHNNADSSQLYLAKLRALYAGWSREFANPALRMYLVQLAPYRTSWMNICMAQSEFADTEPNAEIVVAADQGNFDDIHPNNKETIAHRLALHALRRDYGFGAIESRSPVFRSAEFRDGGAVLRFDNVRSWYVYSPDRSHDAPFELAGADGVWHPARIANFARRKNAKTGEMVEADELTGPEIILSSDSVRRPENVRYMGSPRTAGILFNEMSLPLGPFDGAVCAALHGAGRQVNGKEK